jgi:serine/threonine protein kinase/formylglycine-generating enzyme required for sulfatase activity
MSLPGASTNEPSLSEARHIDAACLQFEAACKAGERPRIEEYLQRGSEQRGSLLRELLALDLAYRYQQGERPTAAEYEQRFPEHEPVIAGVFRDRLAREAQAAAPSSQQAVETGPQPSASRADKVPERLGRHRITGKLGAGGFGVVYKGYDDELRRDVAIKIPRPDRVGSPEQAEDFLAEARVLASLDHPGIIPIYDLGRTDEGSCYVVEKFVAGSDLRKRMAEARFSPQQAVEIVAQVAEALHYAHQHGLVHRDVKPANILIDAAGRPILTDFGLALREDDFGTGPGYAGTPPYMSPEQVRGEGHRVDARTDVYSLSVVFYELLTGQRPFREDNHRILSEEILKHEPRPPRQLDEAIPKELDRICLKGLAKRASDRHSTAIDLAGDLRHWLSGESEKPAVNVQVIMPPADVASCAETSTAEAKGPAGQRSAIPPPAVGAVDNRAADSDQRGTTVVPKGLRSFDAQDADFFLDLLPGPRHRDGLPESIRFWKQRIEATDSDDTFSVGVLYGPSGCGKSSLVKAGLLPNLAAHVVVVYIEATPGETEARLLRVVHKRCCELPEDMGLAETLAWIRKGHAIARGSKLLLVIDQFEQWLHGRPDRPDEELVRALRQCDGGRLQCLLMVRDDFWMAASRFMRQLEIRVVEGQNSGAADLFDLKHARRVLASFGRAFGCLPQSRHELTPDQDHFLDQVATGLARDGKVVPVRLALLAEMVKGRTWTPATLREVGGTEGIGLNFLEETFSAATAPPEHRLHQRAAQAVLNALLPEPGANIRGNMRSRHDLLQASGYARRPQDFDDLIRILDSELRLITPAEPEGVEADGWAVEGEKKEGATRHYQLTHDYLVPALHQWLTRKQRGTWRGRAELRLAERAALWTAKPERRHLPALWEWVNIVLFTRGRDWSQPQRRMMRKATWLYACELGLIAIFASLVGLGAWRMNASVKASSLVQQIGRVETSEVPNIIRELMAYRAAAVPLLTKMLAEAPDGSKEQLHLSLAILPDHPDQAAYLYRRLLAAGVNELYVIREALRGHRGTIGQQLWEVLTDSQNPEERLRAACALADYEPENALWSTVARDVAAKLVTRDPFELGKWSDCLERVHRALVEPLTEIVRERSREQAHRLVAANLVARYAVDQPEEVANLLLASEPRFGALLLPVLKAHPEQAMGIMEEELGKDIEPRASASDKDLRAQRQATAAAVLLELGRTERIWPLFRHSADPTVRTYLIHCIGALGVGPLPLVRRLDADDEVSARRALILALGECPEQSFSSSDQRLLFATFVRWYRDDPDPGVHSAAEWFLRRRKQEQELAKADRQVLAQAAPAERRWYMNRHGDTMAVIAGPVKFVKGSPEAEADRSDNERQREVVIGHSFAIATKEVTVRQFKEFLDANPQVSRDSLRWATRFSPDPDGPIVGVTWHEAAEYCRWLSEKELNAKDQMCYPAVAEIAAGVTAKREEDRGIRLPADQLSLTGYRLPTEAEWEYACRSGAKTSRSFGASDEMLKHYAWYISNSQNRAWPVGSLQPNDFGLFDMYGNASEWTNDRVSERQEKDRLVNADFMAYRGGGAIVSPAATLRSAQRFRELLINRNASVGFRIARTHR